MPATGADQPSPFRDPGGRPDQCCARRLWRRRSCLFLVTAFGLLFVQRLLHLGDLMDSPHAWRQLDTLHYARAMAEQGMNPLLPRVAWMGSHELLALEFPLAQVPVALTFRWLGHDSMVLARLFFLAYSLGALVALWLLIRSLWSARVAAVAAVVAAGSPLAMFYSRALVVDSMVLALTWAGAWLLVGHRAGAWRVPTMVRCWVASTSWALAALVKGPLLLTVVPLVTWVLVLEPWGDDRKIALANGRRLTLVVLPSLVLFVAWRWWSGELNAAAPDWEFIPSYRKMIDNWGWYFGTLTQRMNVSAWQRLLHSMTFRVVGPLGTALILWGALRWRSFGLRVDGRVVSWCLGSAAFVGLFWNLNVVHDYYQLSLIGAGALLVALALVAVAEGSRRPQRSRILLAVVLACVGVINVVMVERTDYRSLRHFHEGGARVRQFTGPQELVIVSWGGLDARSPHLLVPARRRGWSVPDWGLQVDVIERLVSEGAAWLAVFRLEEPVGVTDRWGTPRRVELSAAPETLFLYRLTRTAGPTAEAPAERGLLRG